MLFCKQGVDGVRKFNEISIISLMAPEFQLFQVLGIIEGGSGCKFKNRIIFQLFSNIPDNLDTTLKNASIHHSLNLSEKDRKSI